jgi:hypothetical protein
MKLSHEAYGRTVTIETKHDDVVFEEWMDLLKTLTISATYEEEHWNLYFEEVKEEA